MPESPRHYPPPPPLPPPLPTSGPGIWQPFRQRTPDVAIDWPDDPTEADRRGASRRCWFLIATSLVLFSPAWEVLLLIIPVHLVLIWQIGTRLRWSKLRIVLTSVPAAVPALGAVYAVVTAVLILFSEFRRWLYDDSPPPNSDPTASDATTPRNPHEAILKGRLRMLAGVVTVLILLGKLFVTLGGRDWFDRQQKPQRQQFKPAPVLRAVQ